MANQGISDLGNGIGYIYVVAPDKTTVEQSLENSEENARSIRVSALEGSSVALNRKGTGTVEVDTITGVGSITAIVINGVNQIDTANPIPYTGATSTDDLATLIAAAVNGFDIVATPTYTATRISDTVTFVSPESVGAADNGAEIFVTVTGLSTYDTVDVAGGSDATELYDLSYGYTFFLNSDYDASGCQGSSTPAVPGSLVYALEISDYVIPRNMNSAIPVKFLTLVTGGLTIVRSSVDTLVYVDTQAAAAADDLDTIDVSGFANGDKVTLRGADSTQVTTVKDGTGNIELQGGVDFETDEFETAITLQLKDATWYEVSRTTQAIGSMSDYRTAGYGFFGVDTFTTAAVASAAAVTYDGGTDSKYLELTGGVALGANSDYDLGTGVAGDEFFLQYNAQVTAGAFTLSIFGISLTTAQALVGGLIFHAKYESAAWRVSVMANLDAGVAFPYTIPTELYKALSVTVAKVEATLSTDLITRRVSFESGEECDNTITMGYPGTVVSIDFSVDKVISGTDNGTITPKDNANVAMTNGLITATASATLDTIFATAGVVGGANTFVAGDVLKFTTAKTTKGGFGTLSIKVTKS